MANRGGGTGDGGSVAAMLVEVGGRVRAIRKEAGLTLERLGELSSVSTGILSQIERGLANPSFATLAQVAHGLGIPVGRLFQVADHHRSPVVRQADRRKMGRRVNGLEDGCAYELLTPDLGGALEVNLVETPPGYDSSATPYRHQGEEFGLVLTGRQDVYLDGQKYELGPGDSIRYQSSTPHWYINPGNEICTAIWVNTPPTW